MARIMHHNGDPSPDVLRRHYRVTLPLADFADRNCSPVFEQRIDLGRNAVLAHLNHYESSRLTEQLKNQNGRPYSRIDCRLEILDVPTADVYDEAQLLLRQFMLVVRAPLPVVNAVVDFKIGPTFYRGGYVTLDKTVRNRHGFPFDRIPTLRALRMGMATPSQKPILRALDHYEHSVFSMWRGHMDDAFVQAALAFECLLGNGVRSEISYRLCLRGALLVGGANEVVFHGLRKLYDLRSKIVHGGASASGQNVTHFQQALMRLIPSVMALSIERGSYDEAMKTLDALAIRSISETPQTITEDGWWSYVPLAECLETSVANSGADRWAADVELYDYWTQYFPDEGVEPDSPRFD